MKTGATLKIIQKLETAEGALAQDQKDISAVGVIYIVVSMGHKTIIICLSYSQLTRIVFGSQTN